MPRAVVIEHQVYDDPEEASQDLCRALDLADKLHVYKTIRDWIHRLIDQLLDLTVPASKQKRNMNLFLQQVIDGFAGHFKNKENSRERKQCLRDYAARYLNAQIVKAKSPPKNLSPERSSPELMAVDPDVDAEMLLSAKSDSATLDDDMSGIAMPSNETDFQVDQPPEPSFSPEPANELPAAPSPARELSTGWELIAEPEVVIAKSEVVPSPEPSPSPVPVFSPSRGSVPPPSTGSVPFTSPQRGHSPSPGPALEFTPPYIGPIEQFLSNCYPPMPHLARPFHLAGVVDKNHLHGIACWPQKNVRLFLVKHDIVRTALEEESVVIGFEMLLSNSMQQ